MISTVGVSALITPIQQVATTAAATILPPISLSSSWNTSIANTSHYLLYTPSSNASPYKNISHTSPEINLQTLDNVFGSSGASAAVSSAILNQSFGNLSLLNGSDGSVGGYYPVFPSYIRNTSMIFCVIIMCLGVIGNVMVPIVILKTKDMRNSTNIFLVNLSVADLLVLLVCTPTVLVEVNSRPETWVLGEEMCKAVPFVELTVAHASVLTILAISFERYYAICEPLKAGYVCTKTRASLICLLAWFFAAVFTSPILTLSQYQWEEYFDGTMVPVCWTSAETFWKAFFFIAIISIFFFIPLAVLVILYTIIAYTLMNHPTILLSHNFNSQSVKKKHHHVSQSSQHHQYRKQVILMLGTVVLAFFICLLPFRAFTLWIIIVPSEQVVALGMEDYYNILFFCRIMFHINSAINPILYNLMSSKFREGFRKLCGCKRNKRKIKRFIVRNNDLDRKNTYTNTSISNNSTTHTHVAGRQDSSFWRRISSRNASQKSFCMHSTPQKGGSQRQGDKSSSVITVVGTTKSELKSSLVRQPNNNSITKRLHQLNPASDESYV